MYASPVDAGYANSYGYQADIAAKLTFKIMPVPPPDGADELRMVPDLAGRSLAAPAAVAALEALGLTALLVGGDGQTVETPDDGDEVKNQEPAAGTVLRMEDEVTLTVGPRA
jgi:hypothetical protein